MHTSKFLEKNKKQNIKNFEKVSDNAYIQIPGKNKNKRLKTNLGRRQKSTQGNTFSEGFW